MASFAKKQPNSKSPGSKIAKTGTLTSGAAEIIKTIRERDNENKAKEVSKLREENQSLSDRVYSQQSEIEELSSRNNQLTSELEDVKKEYVELEKSFEESIDLLKQMKTKVSKEQEEKLAIQSDLMTRIRELEAALAESQERGRIISDPNQPLPEGTSAPQSSLAPEHVHQYHIHLRDTLRIMADRLVEGILRLDGDIESTAPLVNAYNQAQKDQSPLIRTIRDSTNDFVFGKPSATYAVAGTQIAEVDEEG